MFVITCIAKADNGPTQYLSDVNLSWWNLKKEGQYTHVVLVSGQFQVRVHSEILLRVSSFLHDLVPPSCSCETPAIILPEVHEDTLKALVEIAYTGRSKVESRKVKEEFELLTELLQIGFQVDFQEIGSREREDHDHSNRSYEAVQDDAATADLEDKTEEKSAAAERRKCEEKATAEIKNSEEKAAAEKRKFEEKAGAERKENKENATAALQKKNKDKSAEYKRQTNVEKTVESRINEEKDVIGSKADAEGKKTKENPTHMRNQISAVQTDFITKNKKAVSKKNEKKLREEMPKETNVLEKADLKLAPPSAKTSKLIKKQSPVTVGRSLPQTRERGRKSTNRENLAIRFLSPISQKRRNKSPDSILEKTTRNQKRKIQNILDDNVQMDSIPESKRKKLPLIVQSTEKSSKCVNIQDITVDSNADIDLFGENDENENNNDLVQDPTKVNAANDSYKRAYFHNSIKNPLENVDMTDFSDEEKAYDEMNDDWDKETECNIKEAMFVCPFCQKEFLTKSKYDQHLSWNHFQVEITDKFPGLECAVCTKRFVKKSNYVHHLGSFHKVVDGLMARAFDGKMAQIGEEQQSKPVATPRRQRKDDSRMETPRRMNIRTPKQNIGTPKQNMGTLKQDIGTPKQNMGTLKQNMGTLKQNMGTLKQDIGTPKQIFRTLKYIDTPRPNIGTPKQILTPKYIDTPRPNIGTPKYSFGIPKQNIDNPKQNICTAKYAVGTPKQNISTPRPNIGSSKYSFGIPKQNICTIGTPKRNNENRSTPKQSEKSRKEPEENRDTSDTATPSKSIREQIEIPIRGVNPPYGRYLTLYDDAPSSGSLLIEDTFDNT